jgi:hypothetical protein
MDFIPISALREISGYRDRRSIAKWVQQSLGIQLHKIGKNWWVVKEEYDTAIRLRYLTEKPMIKPKRKYVPKNKAEDKFLSELEDLLSSKREL